MVVLAKYVYWVFSIKAPRRNRLETLTALVDGCDLSMPPFSRRMVGESVSSSVE